MPSLKLSEGEIQVEMTNAVGHGDYLLYGLLSFCLNQEIDVTRCINPTCRKPLPYIEPFDVFCSAYCDAAITAPRRAPRAAPLRFGPFRLRLPAFAAPARAARLA